MPPRGRRPASAGGPVWRRRALPALLWAALLPGCTGLFFQPEREHAPVPWPASVEREDVQLTTPDGVKLHGWFLRPPGEPAGTVVFFHGNAENVSTHVRSVLWLVLAGYQVLLPDYRGYGRSGGEPEVDGLHADAATALDWAFARPDVDPGRVAVLGQSLGAAIAIHTVATRPNGRRVRLLIADSGFAGYRRITRQKLARLILTWPLQYPLSWLVDDRYSPERWIEGVSPVPVLLIHGGLDRIVPVDHARRLFALAREPKGLWIVQDVGHIRSLSNGDLRKRLLEVLEEQLEERGALEPSGS